MKITTNSVSIPFTQFLNYSDIECSFYVIHKDPKSLKPLNKKILEHKNLKNIVINEFKDTKLILLI